MAIIRRRAVSMPDQPPVCSLNCFTWFQWRALVVPRVKGRFVTPVDGITADGQRVIQGWGGAEGERYVLPGDWRQYGEVVEQIMIDDPRENLTLDCTVRRCISGSTVRLPFLFMLLRLKGLFPHTTCGPKMAIVIWRKDSAHQY